MKIIINEKEIGVDIFNDASKKFISLYAGQQPSDHWAEIRIKRSTMANCVTLATFTSNVETLEIGIPENLLKRGIVIDEMLRFGKFNAAPHAKTLILTAEDADEILNVGFQSGLSEEVYHKFVMFLKANKKEHQEVK